MKNQIEDTVKRHVLSAGVTFLSMFLLTLGAEIGHLGSTEITTAIIFGAIATAARAALKAVFEALFPSTGM